LKSYLVEFPQTKWKLLSDLVTDHSVIPWERREHLAKQLVEAVRQLHSKSFVIGLLWRIRPPIVVDSYDHLYLWDFDKQFAMNSPRSCCFPPEYARFRHIAPAYETDLPSVTAKADIFCLGMALWYLSMGYPSLRFNEESLEEMKNKTIPFEFQKEDCPIVLPALPDTIPKWYRDIIVECRSVNPNDRPPAWRILNEKFPQKTNFEYPQNDPSGGVRSMELRLSSIQKTFAKHIRCCHCWQGVKETLFHCNLCEDRDFDLCVSCYSQGLHCYNEGHLLAEFVERESSWIISKRYHSLVRSSGEREIIEL